MCWIGVTNLMQCTLDMYSVFSIIHYSTEDNGRQRIIAQRNKVAKLKNICSQYTTFTPALWGDNLHMVSAILEDSTLQSIVVILVVDYYI